VSKRDQRIDFRRSAGQRPHKINARGLENRRQSGKQRHKQRDAKRINSAPTARDFILSERRNAT
jgi:hypothetical protein